MLSCLGTEWTEKNGKKGEKEEKKGGKESQIYYVNNSIVQIDSQMSLVLSEYEYTMAF
jgi:hypothetical protein